MNLVVFRYHPGMEEPRYDTFSLDPAPGMTVLSALFAVQERHDATLAFRYSCRGAVCGSCAMLINGVPRLACRTQVQALIDGRMSPPPISPMPAPAGGSRPPIDQGRDVLVEPLPGLPVIRDLIVDMDPFFAAYESLSPALKQAGGEAGQEASVDPAAEKALEEYTNCILCASCYAACPVTAKNPRYPGPAALAQLYRFHLDPRDAPGHSRLEDADTPDGWWACEFHTNCRRVCPRGVPPDKAIGRARREARPRRAED